MCPTPTTERSAAGSRTCTSAVSGSRARTAGSSCASAPMPCAPSTRTASTPSSPTCAPAAKKSEEIVHGLQARQDPPRVLGRYRPLLHNGQEQEDHAGQDGDQEIRSRRPQARDVQGSQNQMNSLG